MTVLTTPKPMATTFANLSGVQPASLIDQAFLQVLSQYGVGNATNYAALRANTQSACDVIYLQGAASLGDGAAGFFLLNPADTSSADNGGTIIVDAAGHRWHRKVEASGEIHLAWWGLDYSGTVANDAAINACIAFAQAQLQSPAASATLDDMSVTVVFPPGAIAINTLITWPDCLNIRGVNRSTTLFCLSAAAGLKVVPFSFPSGGGNPFGWRCDDLIVHGNNLTTGRLIELGGLVSPLVNGLQAEWSLGDGMVLNGTQNGLFERCDISHCGDPSNPSVCASLRLTSGAAGNTFIRCEISEIAGYGLVFGGNTSDNIFMHGEIEYFKGQYGNPYYGSSPGFNILALILADGTEGSQPYGCGNNQLIGTEGAYYSTAGTRAIPAILLRNQADLRINGGIDFSGDSTTTLSQYFCQLGPNTRVDKPESAYRNTLHIHGPNGIGGFKAVIYDAATTEANSQVIAAGETISYLQANPNANYYLSANNWPQDVTIYWNLEALPNVKRGAVRFPSTQIPSSLPNDLDDYNETFGYQSGGGLQIGGSNTGIGYSAGPFLNEIKVGKLVFFTGGFTITSTGGLTGALTIAGLQHTNAGGGFLQVPLYSGMTLAAGNTIAGFPLNNTNNIALYIDGGGGASAPATHTILAGASASTPVSIQYSGCYLSTQ